MDRFEDERLAIELRFGFSLEFPGENVGKIFVVAQRFALCGLMLLAEMPAAGFIAGERVATHQLAELEEIRDPAGALERLVKRFAGTRDGDVVPEFCAQLRDAGDRFLQAGAVAGHSAFVPKEQPELAMERIDRALAVDIEHPPGAFAHFVFRLGEFGVIGRGPFADLASEIVRQGVGEHEIAVGQTLHERAGAEAIGAVIGEIRFADDMQAGNVAHQIVVHPEAAHRVMDRRVNPHRRVVGIVAGDFFVDVEKISVTLADGRLAEARDRVLEVEINAAPARADAAAFVANFLGAARGNIARGEVAVARVFALEIIIAIGFRDVVRRPGAIFFPLRHPDAAVVAERLGHESQFRLVVAADWDAGRVDLGVARVGEKRAFLVGAIGGGDVAAAGVGREIENVAVTAGREDHRIGRMPDDFAGDEVARDDALGVAVDHDEVEHLGLRKHRHGAGLNLPANGLIRA